MNALVFRMAIFAKFGAESGHAVSGTCERYECVYDKNQDEKEDH